MHPRNPYRNPPNFSALAEKFPPLRPFVSLSSSGKPSINFQDPQAQRALAQALLRHDFNITLHLPEDRLCPTVPNRMNYILWLQDVLFAFEDCNSNQNVKGLDIGTGASAIYPILACSALPSNQKWSFVATEADSLSASFAYKNIEANNLSSRISIWPISQISPDNQNNIDPILAPLIQEPESRYDFTMCNPPFYGSTAEIENSAESKEIPPNAVCTGAETEMITPGGEVAFVLRMIQESIRDDVKGRCRWFTSMLGKLNSVGTVVEELHKFKVDNYALTQFIQGTTRRWAIGWSFGDERLPDAIARPASSSLSPYLPAPTTLRQSFTIPSEHRTHDLPKVKSDFVRSILCQALKSIDGLTFHESHSTGHGGTWKFDVQAMENTWSRAARRKRKRLSSPSPGRAGKVCRQDSNTIAATDPVGADAPPLTEGALGIGGITLHCHLKSLGVSSSDPGASSSVTLEIQWVRGLDRALFESFWNHLCRKIKNNVS